MPLAAVIIIGIDTALIDFSDPAYAPYPGLDESVVRSGLEDDVNRLAGLGFEADLLLVDFGATAEKVLTQRLQQKSYDCVVIGAGMRLIPKNTVIFEKVLNIVHGRAPDATICFNTGPTDSADAVLRWVRVQ